MPYKNESVGLKLPEKYDDRCKLTNAQREEIHKLYGKISQRKLAKLYGVSRRLIQFIGCPEKKEQEYQRRLERGGSKIYYDRKKHNLSIKNLRHKRKILHDKGLLEEK